MNKTKKYQRGGGRDLTLRRFDGISAGEVL